MRNYTVWAPDDITNTNQVENKKAIRNQLETIKLIDSVGGLHGNVLDVGSRNSFTELLEKKYDLKIDSTVGDLDMGLNCPDKHYDFVHYNNVIEHQFNPLRTLLEIREVLKGYLILGTPLKPKWITSAKCHFHEFDQYSYNLILERSGFSEIKRMHFYYQYSIKGIRQILGSMSKRQVLSILTKG